MSQREKDNQIQKKDFFNSKEVTPYRTRTGSHRKNKKAIVKRQYEDDYKDLIPPNSNDVVVEKKSKFKHCSSDTHDFKTKWKTEICHYWEVNGTCKYGDNCAFAHGQNELKNKKMANSYKTKLCKRFFEKGYCPYGSRCQFSHKNLEKRLLSYLILLSNFTQNDNIDDKLAKRPRLKTFENLSVYNNDNEEKAQHKEGKCIDLNDLFNSLDTKDNDKEDMELRERYLSL